MSLIIQNLSRLEHFDANGKFFSLENASIRISDRGIIQEIKGGPLRSKPGYKKLDGKGLLGLPAFVDCHSHSLFAGDRANEFELKSQGKTYTEIAAAGGGILSTQQATLNASDAELTELLSSRIDRFISQGVRGLEIKTGYGLTHQEEIRHLRILQKLKKKVQRKIKIWVTYLGPHAVPKQVDRKIYLEEILHTTLPQIAKEQLADFVDIFVDEGFFSANEMQSYCTISDRLGLKMKAHIDEIKNLDASDIAISHGLVSVDHCRHTTLEQFDRLLKGGVQVVFLPATSFFIEEGFLDFQPLRKLGLQPALSLDYNPGSQPALWWPLLLHLGMKKMKMTHQEVCHATTVAPLLALSEKVDDWCFQVGMPCKLNLFQAKTFSEIAYRYGENLLVKSFFFQ